MAENGNEARVQRWSAKRKTEGVLRLLRDEDPAEISREIQVPAHEIEGCRRGLGSVTEERTSDILLATLVLLRPFAGRGLSSSTIATADPTDG